MYYGCLRLFLRSISYKPETKIFPESKGLTQRQKQSGVNVAMSKVDLSPSSPGFTFVAVEVLSGGLSMECWGIKLQNPEIKSDVCIS